MATVLISGGHLTPALAVIDQAQLEERGHHFIFLGRKYSQEATKQLSQEESEVQKRGLVFIPTLAPKFHKTYWWRNIVELRKFPRAALIAWKTIRKYKPDLFLSFGGYLAFPIAFACRIAHIPVITHEQTTSRGMANQIIAFLSDKVAVSYKSSLEFFPKEKSVLTGNPIRPNIIKPNPKRPEWLSYTPSKPILYITGGNQGSEILNSTVEQTLPILTNQWFIIHQCGNPSKTLNYFQRLTQAQSKLNKQQQKSYIVRPWVDEHDLAWIYSHATTAVSRSGANTIQELVVHSLPSLLIPLPFSHNNEQQKNAEILANAKCAIMLLQKDLTPESFLEKLQEIKDQQDSFKKRATKLQDQFILNGSTTLLDLIDQTLVRKTN